MPQWWRRRRAEAALETAALVSWASGASTCGGSCCPTGGSPAGAGCGAGVAGTVSVLDVGGGGVSVAVVTVVTVVVGVVVLVVGTGAGGAGAVAVAVGVVAGALDVAGVGSCVVSAG